MKFTVVATLYRLLMGGGISALMLWSPEGMAGIDMTIEPAVLTLGEDQTSRIDLILPTETVGVSFAADIGTIRDVNRSSEGMVVATYVPPKQVFPANDSVVAWIRTDDGIRVAVGRIALVGQGKARIFTDPGAEASIRIGNTVFGPATADSTGLALVDIEVPPGITHGIVDDGKRISLGVPSLPRVGVVFEGDDEYYGPGKAVKNITIVAYSHGESELRSQMPVVSARHGVVGAVEEIDTGVYRTQYRISGDGSYIGLETIQVRYLGEVVNKPLRIVDVKQVSDDEYVVRTPEEMHATPAAMASVVDPLEYRLFLSVKGGIRSDWRDWFSGDIEIDAGFGMPVGKTVMGGGIRTGFFRSRQQDSMRDGGTRYDVYAITRVVPIQGVLWWRIPIGESFAMMTTGTLGGAFVFNNLDYRVTGEDNNVIMEHSVAFVSGVDVALERYLWRGGVVVQAGVHLVSVAGTSIVGRMLMTQVVAGYRFYFI